MAFTAADYILKRLSEQGVDTLFGVPAAYCAPLFDAAPAHGIKPVVTASDLEAGYAADGYARTKGLAAVSVSYGVGTLSMINAIAGAYVERSPVVVINGGPTSLNLTNLHSFDVMFSHSIGQDATDLAAYKLVTASAARAAKAADVPALLDKAIVTAITKQRPVYLEINMASWNVACPMPTTPLVVTRPPAGTEKQLATKIVAAIRAAQSPAILIGTEIQRYRLADQVLDLVTNLGVGWASDLLAKSTLAEEGPGWIGVYDPPHARLAVKNAVEQADLLVTLGSVYPNGYAPLLSSPGAINRIIQVYDGKVRLKGAAKQDAEIGALVTALVAEAKKAPQQGPAGAAPVAPPPASGALTYEQVFGCVGNALDATLLTIPDTFLGVFSCANLPVKGRDAFLVSGVWASIGHSVSAAVGAFFGSSRRPLAICGDGGFHMTAQSLSTMVQYGAKPIVLVIANGIYGYEQELVDPTYFTSTTTPPRPYVVLNSWDFVKFAEGLGFTFARSVATAAALDTALADAKAYDGPALIAANVDPRGLPSELQ